MGMKTLSGDRWAGPIGKSLPKVQDMELKEEFKPVPGETELLELPAEVVDDLSVDILDLKFTKRNTSWCAIGVL